MFAAVRKEITDPIWAPKFEAVLKEWCCLTAELYPTHPTTFVRDMWRTCELDFQVICAGSTENSEAATRLIGKARDLNFEYFKAYHAKCPSLPSMRPYFERRRDNELTDIFMFAIFDGGEPDLPPTGVDRVRTLEYIRTRNIQYNAKREATDIQLAEFISNILAVNAVNAAGNTEVDIDLTKLNKLNQGFEELDKLQDDDSDIMRYERYAKWAEAASIPSAEAPPPALPQTREETLAWLTEIGASEEAIYAYTWPVLGCRTAIQDDIDRL